MDTYSSTQHSHGTIKVLGFAGLIPFLVPAGLMLQAAVSAKGFESAALFGFYAPYVFITYSAIILSFLCGALWGKAVTGDSRQPAMLIFSNLIALSAWSCTLLIYLAPIMSMLAVAMLLAGFLAVLFCEREFELAVCQRNSESDFRNSSYWKMRWQLTGFVCLLHLLVIYLMIREL